MDRQFSEELAVLQARFEAQLPAKLAQLGEAIVTERTNEARSLSHRLAGSAGTYGMSKLGEALRALEDAFDRAPVSWSDVRDLFVAAERALDPA